jgi:hypothetical protein
MASDPILDEISLTTHKEIYPRVVEDQFFLDTPLQAYIRDHCTVPFGGGAFMQNTFLYAPLIGGAVAKGDTYNITKRQTLSGSVFDMRKYVVSIPEYLEDIEIENKGPNAVFSLLDIDARNAMQTISAIIAVDMSLHGRATGDEATLVGNRSKAINGWIEALSDGVTPGWDGSIFTKYGTQVRNSAIGSVLNSVPYFVGDLTGATGPITYNNLIETYMSASIGRESPDLGVTNKAAFAYVLERIQPQQRFTVEKDPLFGANGFRFMDAMILKDDYFPSLKYGKNDPDLGNYLTGTFTSPASTDSSAYVVTASNMPASTTINVGEVFCWFNTRKILFRISNSRTWGFGMSGFIPAQDSSKVVAHLRAAVNMEFLSSRLHKQIFGIGA